MISLALLMRSAKGLLGSVPLHIESSVTLIGIPNLECAVLPLGSNKAAIMARLVDGNKRW